MSVHDCSVEEGHCCIFYGLRRESLEVMTTQLCNCPCHYTTIDGENSRHSIINNDTFDSCFIEAQSRMHEVKERLEARLHNAPRAHKAVNELYDALTQEMIRLRKNLESL